jgi:hypothetical protein
MADDGFLHRYFLNNGGKRLHKWVHYFDIYSRHFERFRDRQPVVLEIGVFGGGSLALSYALLLEPITQEGLRGAAAPILLSAVFAVGLAFTLH